MTEKDPPNHKEEPNFVQIYSKRKLPLIESRKLFHNIHPVF